MVSSRLVIILQYYPGKKKKITKPSFPFQIAAEVAAPLAKTDEIVLLGGADRTTTEVSRLLGQLPPAVQALSGVDISGVSESKEDL